MYARQVADRTLTLLVSGKLWRNSLIMQDLETETLWSHVTGEALDGELVGRYLEIIPAVHTTWAEWRAEHPETLLLKKSEEIKSSRYAGYFDDPEKTGMFRANWLQDRLPGKTLVYGLRWGPHATAVTAEVVADGEPHQIEIGDHEVTVQKGDDGGVRAWTAAGESLDVLTVFWFAWSSFYANTTVVD